jgi:hypothetical protein
MAKRATKAGAGTDDGGMISSGGPVQGADDAAGVEQRMVDFAEDLGTLLGSAQKKASEWMSQRQAVADQLTKIRDTANDLLSRLTGGGANMAVAVTRARRGRPPGSGRKAQGTAKKGPGRPKGRKRNGMSAEGRARVAAAQKARWAKLRKERGREVGNG